MTDAVSSWQPVKPQRNGLWQNAAVITLVGVLAGTGGHVSAEQILKQFGTGSASRIAHGLQAAERDHGLAVELKVIREALRLSVAETAQMFGVSRPTIYNWQNGSPISSIKAERVREIASAIAPHLRLLEAQVGRVADRAIEGRMTLLQTLVRGSSADKSIKQLIEIIERETAQRERLARRLQGRSGSRGSVDLDILG